jgi:hypothetical protein
MFVTIFSEQTTGKHISDPTNNQSITLTFLKCELPYEKISIETNRTTLSQLVSPLPLLKFRYILSEQQIHSNVSYIRKIVYKDSSPTVYLRSALMHETFLIPGFSIPTGIKTH